MASNKISFLAVVLYLTAATPGCQAQCQAGEVEVVTVARCDVVASGLPAVCLGEGDSPLPETVRSIQPISSPDPSTPCFYQIRSVAEILGAAFSIGVCEAKVTSCVADQGTGGTGSQGPCQANETAVVTPATCVIVSQLEGGFCLGEGGLELPGRVQSFEPAQQEDCFYAIVSPTQLKAISALETCEVKATSCVAGQGTGGTGDNDTSHSDRGDCSKNGGSNDSGDSSDTGGSNDSRDSSDTDGSNESR